MARRMLIWFFGCLAASPTSPGPTVLVVALFNRLTPARVLKTDGAIYVRVPNFGSINRHVMGARWSGFRYPDHVNYFTLGSLRRMTSDCGLRLKLLNPALFPLNDNINAVLTKTR